MADVPPQSSPGVRTPGVPSSAGPAAGGDDPFQKLFKMSVTAGLGSGDYVAVNGTAIVALLLGLASVVVFLNTAILLVIPLAGLVCSVLAFAQIARSNGTQTGREIAAVALLLSLGLGGFFGIKSAVAAAGDRADREKIVGLIRGFGDSIRDEKFDAAYAACDARFQKQVTRPEFDAKWRVIRQSEMFGSLTGMDWNKLLAFDDDPVTGDRLAGGQILFHFSSDKDDQTKFRSQFFFRLVDGTWKIDRMELFPPPAPDTKKKPAFGPMGPPAPGSQ